MKNPSPTKVVKVKAYAILNGKTISGFGLMDGGRASIYQTKILAQIHAFKDSKVVPCFITYQPIRTSKRK